MEKIAPVTHILPLTYIQRDRTLPVPGKVLCRKGQKVNGGDVLAEASLNPDHIVLDIARGLGLSAEKADRHLQYKVGDKVGDGDILAGPVGMGRRVVRTPHAGKVVLAGGGQVLIEREGTPYELQAGLSGEVVDLIPDRGATIGVSGALIQGVWGNGRADYGLLNVLLRSPEEELTAAKLDVSFRGSVVLGGYIGDQEVFAAATELPLRGLIVASMPASFAPLALNLPFPLIILEGFGRLSLSSAAYNLLSTNVRREISLLADPWEQLTGKRPEIIIPLPSEGGVQPPLETDVFKPNQVVRILRAPWLGKVGTLVAVHPGMVALPSGLRAHAADVRLESGETIVAALANLEVLE